MSTSQRLTEEQRQLVSDNHNLIYAYAHKMNLDLDEYYDLLAIGLCLAACSYDPSKGTTFSTYAYSAMRNTCYMYWRRNYVSSHRIPKELIISYNAPFGDDFGKEELVNRLDDIFGTYDFSPTPVELNEFLKSLKKTERIILHDSYYGYTQTEISQKLGISQSFISRIRRTLKEKWLSGKYKVTK